MSFWTKNQSHHLILFIGISVGSKFQLQLTILIFWNKSPKKTIFSFENTRNERHHWYLHILISLRAKFQLKLTILTFFFFLIKVYLVFFFSSKNFRSKKNINKNKKNTTKFCILKLDCTELLLKLTLLIFWKHFIQKEYLWSKTDKMNTAIDFCIFELV